MNRDSIITLPNPHLRQKSRQVKGITKAVRQLVAHMQDATIDWERHREHELGVALAAVQVDELYRIVIVRKNFEYKEDQSFLTLINPTITSHAGKPTKDYEGCLSVKDVYGLVPRYSKVRIKALGLDGKEIHMKAEGFLARVLQHEIDHTNGILFIDHIKNDKDAYFTLKEDGQLSKVPYETIAKSDLLW